MQQSVALAKCLVETSECVAVADLVLLDASDSFGAAFGRDGNCLNPRLDVLLGSKLQHSNHLRVVANVTGTDVGSVGCKVLSLHGGKVVIGETDVVEATHDYKSAKVGRHVEFLGHIRAWSVLVGVACQVKR
jgi:hypothetical protein